MTRRLLEGSEAIAEAMVAAGCRFFAGYPMTPFTEVLEHMARLLPASGGVCINAESEIEAVGMAWGASAGGARAATGSVGQGLSLMQESLAELWHARLPVVVLNMARGQGDYFQATRGGGHGDYRHPVLAPSDLPEAVTLVQHAFDLADKWRTPVMVMGDYYLAHVREAVDTGPTAVGGPPPRDWALDGRSSGSGHAKIISPILQSKHDDPDRMSYGEYLMTSEARLTAVRNGIEPRFETGFMDGAELLVVSYGTPGRYLRHCVAQLREEGLPIGFLRPITLWPFPTDAVAAAAEATRTIAVYELNAGQMFDDVRLAAPGHDVRFIGGISFDSSAFGVAPDLRVGKLKERLRDVLVESRRSP